ncbi:MAG: cellulase family glycosylhydrolase [Solobacterium sp.]|nr:cellulase family glycosylhydrolase [Solobacterium sp.]
MTNAYSLDRVKGFLHADGTKMVNGDGEQVVLRGWGTGNWVNLEGFMIGGTPDSIRFRDDLDAPRWFDRGRTVDSAVRILCGDAYAEEFWKKWHANHLAEGDIKLMAELGCNSVRLVLNAGQLLNEDPSKLEFREEGFRMIDEVLDWCEKYHVYAILDMHGAPYGHSSVDIDDGIDNYPHLLIDEEAFDRGVALWVEMAKRWKDRWIVAGYELLNEPIFQPKWTCLMPRLREFFDTCIAEIRKFDTKHMFFLEGQNGAHDIQPFDHCYDPGYNNWAITIHYYGFTGNLADLAPFLAMSRHYNVPIWMGEGGVAPEYAPHVYEMARRFDIGWNQWCWKTAANPEREGAGFGRRVTSYALPEGWADLQKFFFGGPRPGYEKSKKIFDEMLENMKIENCIIHKEVMDPQMRRPDLDLYGPAYDYSPYPGETFSGGWDFGNALAYRVEDHTKLVLRPGAPMPNLIPPERLGTFSREERMNVTKNNNAMKALMLELGENGFAVYTVRDVTKPCSLKLEVYAPEGGEVCVKCDDELLADLKVTGSTGMQEVPAGTVPAGEEHKICIAVKSGTVCVGTLKFRY